MALYLININIISIMCCEQGMTYSVVLICQAKHHELHSFVDKDHVVTQELTVKSEVKCEEGVSVKLLY